MSTSVSIHFAGDISADAGGTLGAPLTISINREAPRIGDQIPLFTQDLALSRKLADAINATVKAHRTSLEKPEAA